MSNEQTKMPRFSLESPRPCTISVLFCAHTLCMITLPTRFYWLVLQYGVNNYCVLCTVKAKTEQKHTTKKFVGFHNHSPLLTNVLRTYLRRNNKELCLFLVVIKQLVTSFLRADKNNSCAVIVKGKPVNFGDEDRMHLSFASFISGGRNRRIHWSVTKISFIKT